MPPSLAVTSYDSRSAVINVLTSHGLDKSLQTGRAGSRLRSHVFPYAPHAEFQRRWNSSLPLSRELREGRSCSVVSPRVLCRDSSIWHVVGVDNHRRQVVKWSPKNRCRRLAPGCAAHQVLRKACGPGA